MSPREQKVEEARPATADNAAELSTRLAVDQNAAANSVAIAGWTLCSRLTGFGRVSMVAAVLGPTYLGSTFQATNQLPNLLFELLTGTLIVSLLVPVLVQSDMRRRIWTERVAQSFLGLTTVCLTLVAIAGALLAPLLLEFLTVGVAESSVAEAQQTAGLTLLLFVLPQVPLYGLAYIGAASMNARGRFKLAAAAPAVENVCIIAVLAASALIYGVGGDVSDVATGNLILLGGGCTAAVALHAALQWFGAARVGIWLIPRTGWRTPELRGLIERIRPSVGYSALNVSRLFLALAVANRVPGGVVAFMLALNFLYLPVNAGARPVATAMLPDLSRLSEAADYREFGRQMVRGNAAVAFLVLPLLGAYLALAEPIARAASLGEMSTPDGLELIAFSLVALAPGMLAEASFVFTTLASYAHKDAKAPFHAMAVRSSVSMLLMLGAFFVESGPAVLILLGLGISVGNIAGAAYLRHRLRKAISDQESPRGDGGMTRILLASGLAVAIAFLTAHTTNNWLKGEVGEILSVLAALLVGATIYLLCSRKLETTGWLFFSASFARSKGKPAHSEP